MQNTRVLTPAIPGALDQTDVAQMLDIARPYSSVSKDIPGWVSTFSDAHKFESVVLGLPSQ